MGVETSSWEWKLEDFAIKSCAPPALPIGLQLIHLDEQEDAKLERIIFTAVSSDEDPAGSGVYAMQLTAELRSTNRSAVQVDQLFAAMVKAFTAPSAITYAGTLFQAGLWIDQESSEDSRNNAQNSRIRSRSFNFHAGQIQLA